METTNLTAPQFAAALREISACQGALEWSAGMDYNTAWNTCQNPRWLLFLLDAVAPLTAINNERLVCAFAREVLHLTTDPRVLACIETREAWANGTATRQERAAAIAAVREAADSDVKSPAIFAAKAAGNFYPNDAARIAAWDAIGSAARVRQWDDTEAARGQSALIASHAARVRQCAIIRQLIPQPALSYAPALQS